MSAPVRVLFTIPNFKTAGGGQVVADLCRHLDRDRVAPTVCVESAGGALEAELAAIDVPVVEHPFTVGPLPRASLLLRCRAIAGPLRALRADVWHSWHYADDYTEPLVARLAGGPAWVFTKKSMAWRDSGWKPRSVLATAIVATNTDMVEQFFSTPFLRRKSEVIPIGVDLERFATAAPLDLRALAGIPSGAPVVAVVARIVRGKSIEVAVRAMAEVPDAHLVLAGRTDNPDHLDYVDELRRLIGDLGLADRVHLVGHVADVAGLLAASTAFLLPTGHDAEGCPVAVLEGHGRRLGLRRHRHPRVAGCRGRPAHGRGRPRQRRDCDGGGAARAVARRRPAPVLGPPGTSPHRTGLLGAARGPGPRGALPPPGGPLGGVTVPVG